MCRVSQPSCRPPFQSDFRMCASEFSTVRVHFSRLCSASTFRGSFQQKQNCRWLTGVTMAKRRRLCSPATRIRQQTAEPQFQYSSPQRFGFHVLKAYPEEHGRHAWSQSTRASNSRRERLYKHAGVPPKRQWSLRSSEM
jgi:hypothetical protein